MSNGGRKKKLQGWFSRTLDEWKMAGSGVVLATRSPRFLTVFGVSFVVFGTLMSLLSSSTASLNLFFATDLSGKMAILRDAFLGLFGVNRNFWDWLMLFAITLIQSTLIGLVALAWQKKRRNKKSQVVAVAKNADNVQNAGIAAGLAVLGSGCPTCGTTLLAPVLGTLFSSTSYALASAISGILTAAAIVLALVTLKRIGREVFVIYMSERYEKRQKEAQSARSEE